MKKKMLPRFTPMIREAQFSDLNCGLLDCLSELYKIDFQRAGSTFLEREHYGNVFTYVYVSKDRVLGTASLIVDAKYGHEGRKAATIEDVAVLKDIQGGGIGTKLVQFLVEFARSLGCYKATLNCSQHNETFYRRLGFKNYETHMRIDL